jgi:RecA-family ATPase
VPAEELASLQVANCRGLEVNDPVTAVMNTIRLHRPSLVILDPLYMLHDGDENAAVDMVPLIRRLSAMMAETGVALVIVHHDAKGRAGDRDIRDRGSGSGVFSRSCDARLTLTPHADSDDLACIAVMARNHPPQEGFVCRMDTGVFVEDGAEFEPATSRNAARKIKSAAVALDGAQAVAQEIAAAGPFDADTVEEMLKDRCGKKDVMWKAGKKTLKEMAARGEVILVVSRHCQKDLFGPVNNPAKWRRIGIEVGLGVPACSQGVPACSRDAGTPPEVVPVPASSPAPCIQGPGTGTGTGVYVEAFSPEDV